MSSPTASASQVVTFVARALGRIVLGAFRALQGLLWRRILLAGLTRAAAAAARAAAAAAGGGAAAAGAAAAAAGAAAACGCDCEHDFSCGCRGCRGCRFLFLLLAFVVRSCASAPSTKASSSAWHAAPTRATAGCGSSSSSAALGSSPAPSPLRPGARSHCQQWLARQRRRARSVGFLRRNKGTKARSTARHRGTGGAATQPNDRPRAK